MTRQRLIDRIARLLRKTPENGCSAREAAAARRKAEALMRDHGVAADEVRAAQKRDSYTRAIRPDLDRAWGEEAADRPGALGAMAAVAALVPVGVQLAHVGPPWRRTILLVGRPEDLAAAKERFPRLCDRLERAWEVFRLRHRADPALRASYILGLGQGLADRIERDRRRGAERAARRRRPSNPGREVALRDGDGREVRLAELEQFLREMAPPAGGAGPAAGADGGPGEADEPPPPLEELACLDPFVVMSGRHDGMMLTIDEALGDAIPAGGGSA